MRAAAARARRVPERAWRVVGATYVALSGGVGGAKLSLGLSHLLGSRLTIIVNTGDDFEHLGLHVSPDIDTTLYTLAGLVNEETGWGRRDETLELHASDRGDSQGLHGSGSATAISPCMWIAAAGCSLVRR